MKTIIHVNQFKIRRRQKGPSHLSIVERLGRGSIDFTIAGVRRSRSR